MIVSWKWGVDVFRFEATAPLFSPYLLVYENGEQNLILSRALSGGYYFSKDEAMRFAMARIFMANQIYPDDVEVRYALDDIQCKILPVTQTEERKDIYLQVRSLISEGRRDEAWLLVATAFGMFKHARLLKSLQETPEWEESRQKSIMSLQVQVKLWVLLDIRKEYGEKMAKRVDRELRGGYGE